MTLIFQKVCPGVSFKGATVAGFKTENGGVLGFVLKHTGKPLMEWIEITHLHVHDIRREYV